jgi:hypothetical protein
VRFTLYYRGILKANRGSQDKHDLRRHFHAQLKEAWSLTPLSTYARFVDPSTKGNDGNVLRTIGAFEFAPLVCQELGLVAELRITMFRPQAPGALVGTGGDIDNRLKTVLDSLKVPAEPNALPATEQPRAGEAPFYCLLEDDKLITELSVKTERLLEPNLDANEVLLLIHVTVKQVHVFIGTLGMGS